MSGSIPVAHPAPTQRWEWRFPRRALLMLFAALSVFGLAGVALAVTWPEEPTQAQWIDAVELEDLVVGAPVRPNNEHFWLVRTDDSTVIALLDRSPHRGCRIAWHEEGSYHGLPAQFRDPCSGSSFRIDGSRLYGPSPRGMDAFHVSIQGGIVRVDVSKVICSDGESWCPPARLKPF